MSISAADKNEGNCVKGAAAFLNTMIDIRIAEQVFQKAVRMLKRNGIIDDAKAEWINRVFCTINMEIGKAYSYQQSACLIHKPVMDRGEVFFDSFTLRVGCHPDSVYQRYILYHELAHLFSIGEIEKEDEHVYIRPWGICRTLYWINEGGIHTCLEKENLQENERINDCLACYMYTKLEDTELHDRILYKRGMYADRDQEELIKMYLQNDIRGILRKKIPE